ncbi:MAG: hypothetical protein B6U78_02990 [Candidatus Aenigmarchaeota archaeon ex4484_224]|nr:MAG: hypothetical protein B6U78_02990 [Candidatus Aenigmarchaeota archaeon ex4484_224]
MKEISRSFYVYIYGKWKIKKNLEQLLEMKVKVSFSNLFSRISFYLLFLEHKFFLIFYFDFHFILFVFYFLFKFKRLFFLVHSKF